MLTSNLFWLMLEIWANARINGFHHRDFKLILGIRVTKAASAQCHDQNGRAVRRWITAWSCWLDACAA